MFVEPEVFTEWIASRGDKYVYALHEVWAAMLATAGKD